MQFAQCLVNETHIDADLVCDAFELGHRDGLFLRASLGVKLDRASHDLLELGGIESVGDVAVGLSLGADIGSLKRDVVRFHRGLTLPGVSSEPESVEVTRGAEAKVASMKIAVEFPSVAYREGRDKVLDLAKAIESIGYDELAVFDHVVMGFPGEGRTTMYPARMPILEAFVTLALVTAVTDRVSLSTEVLVLPQRQPVLVAKQVSTLDTLSNGRIRLGVGVSWQDSEYDALEEDFTNRGRRMDECIDLLRTYWGDEEIEFAGEFYQSTAMGMEPKPPQGADIPICCLLYTSPSPRDATLSRMPSSA